MTTELTMDMDRLLKFLVHRVVALEVQGKALTEICCRLLTEEGESIETMRRAIREDMREAMTTMKPELELELVRQAGVPHGWLGELIRGWHEGEPPPDPPESRSSSESTPGPT